MADFSVLRARLERAGLDPQSAEWLLKALSPATPAGAGCQIPDASAVATANPEFVNTYTISAPNTSANWDCLIVKTPTYPLLGYIVTGPAGTDFTGTWSGLNVTVMQAEPATSATFDGVSTCSWVVTGGALTTGIVLNTLLPSTQPIAWRTTARSSTEYLVASDLNNQGTVTSGQYVPRIQSYNPGTVYGLPATTTAFLYTLDTCELPLSEANMTAMNPKVRVAPAKQGVYQPLYNAGPTFCWARGTAMPPLAYDWSFPTNTTVYTPIRGMATGPLVTGGVPSVLFLSDPTTGLVSNTWASNGFLLGYPLVAGNPYTFGNDNGMAGVSIYRGLAGAASITVKLVTALELAPAPTSPIRQFVIPAANHDPKAMQLYYDLVHDMPHTYPASSNFLGAVLSAVGSLLPSVLPHVSGIIQSARGVFGKVPGDTAHPESQPEMRSSATSRAAPRVMVEMRPRPAIKVRASSVSSRVSSRASRKTVKSARRRRGAR